MAIVDSVLIEKFEQAGDSPLPVIIVCQNECESVAKALEHTGIPVISKESMVLGSIGTQITADQLQTVKAIPGISAIEFDDETKALSQPTRKSP